jgi:hypothetical protein
MENSMDRMILSADYFILSPGQTIASADKIAWSGPGMILSPDKMKNSTDRMILSIDSLIVSDGQIILSGDSTYLSADKMILSGS